MDRREFLSSATKGVVVAACGAAGGMLLAPDAASAAHVHEATRPVTGVSIITFVYRLGRQSKIPNDGTSTWPGGPLRIESDITVAPQPLDPYGPSEHFNVRFGIRKIVNGRSILVLDDTWRHQNEMPHPNIGPTGWNIQQFSYYEPEVHPGEWVATVEVRTLETLRTFSASSRFLVLAA